MFKRHLDNKSASTLVELIMTIVVTTIISIPLSLLLSQHVQSAFQSEDITMAANLARLEMEKAKNIGYSAATIPVYQMYNYDITRTVSIFLASGPEGLKKIQVDVKKTGSVTNLVSLITYLENNVGYGP